MFDHVWLAILIYSMTVFYMGFGKMEWAPTLLLLPPPKKKMDFG